MMLNAAAYSEIRHLLLKRGQRIRHPKPEMAVVFAISAIAALFQERILFGDVTALPRLSDRR